MHTHFLLYDVVYLSVEWSFLDFHFVSLVELLTVLSVLPFPELNRVA